MVLRSNPENPMSKVIQFLSAKQKRDIKNRKITILNVNLMNHAPFIRNCTFFRMAEGDRWIPGRRLSVD